MAWQKSCCLVGIIVLPTVQLLCFNQSSLLLSECLSVFILGQRRSMNWGRFSEPSSMPSIDQEMREWGTETLLAPFVVCLLFTVLKYLTLCVCLGHASLQGPRRKTICYINSWWRQMRQDTNKFRGGKQNRRKGNRLCHQFWLENICNKKWEIWWLQAERVIFFLHVWLSVFHQYFDINSRVNCSMCTI